MPLNSRMDAIRVDHLQVAFQHKDSSVTVIEDLSIAVAPGTITGIVGESGSGKSTAILAAIGYVPPGAVRVRGTAMVGGANLLELERARLREYWGRRIGYVPQDAIGSLDPVRKIGSQIKEVLRVNLGLDRSAATTKSVELLEDVMLPNATEAIQKYPHQFSGGQVQRIAMAIALACGPDVLVLDEPTTGLDVTTQAAIVSLIRQKVETTHMAVILVSHDFAQVAAVADQIVVLYAGEIVESGSAAEIATSPRHPYTRALLDAVPSVSRRDRPRGLPGLPPGRAVMDSCSFVARCRWAIDECYRAHPCLDVLNGSTHQVRCFRTGELGKLSPQKERIGDRSGPSREEGTPLLSVRGLVCGYRSKRAEIVAVDGVDLDVFPGEVVGLVGESGSGKTTVARGIAGAVDPRSGSIVLAGHSLPTLGHRTKEQYQQVQLIFQNPDSSLNPRQTVAEIVGRSVQLFRSSLKESQRQTLIEKALIEVQLDPETATRYPDQLSGGQKQRVAIARAFAAKPQLILCDEILTGQDVSVQATLLELVEDMQVKHGVSLLFISHDLAAVRSIAQFVYVMKDGKVVEHGYADQLFDEPQHAYTQQLLEAVPGRTRT